MGRTARQRFTRRIRTFVARGRERLGGQTGNEPHAERTDDREDTSDSGRDTESLQRPRERILSALVQQGGRARQRELVAAVDWSESTVSRKLCKLESADRIVRHEIGREKLVFLPEEAPESAESPFTGDDERERITA